MTQVFTMLKVWLAVAALAFFEWLAPLKWFVLFTLALVFFDLFAGIQAARKRGEAIHSRGLRRTVTKFLLYCLAILSMHGIETVFEIPAQITYTIALFIAVSESLSILENVSEVTGKNLVGAVISLLSIAQKSKLPDIDDDPTNQKSGTKNM